jgi:hypothetical protein
MQFTLSDPAKPLSACSADVHVRFEQDDDGKTRILWDAQEFQDGANGRCESVGPEYEGVSTIDGPCCAEVVDIRLPIMQRTFRLSVQTDWTNTTGQSLATITGSSKVVPLSRWIGEHNLTFYERDMLGSVKPSLKSR